MNNVLSGDCRKLLPTLPAASASLVLTDPPYPCVPRDYGTWTEEEWFTLMDVVVPEVRRVLTPRGSAVFILRPNSESAGRMRLWLWEFLAKWGRLWNVVQDCYAWNHAQLPFGGATTCGLLRGSVSHCVWLGAPDCYRNQGAVLWSESDDAKRRKLADRAALAAGRTRKTGFTSASASKRNSDVPRLDATRAYAAADRRGGVTPFNVVMATNTKNPDAEAGAGHPARTAPDVARFWTRYLTRPGDTILDPFCGSGTVLEVAAEEGRDAVGIEVDPKYVRELRVRLKAKARRA